MAAENLFSDAIDYVYQMACSFMGSENAVVSVGGTGVNRPSEFIVREIAQNPTFTDRVTSAVAMGASRAQGTYRVEFDVACEAWSTKTDLLAVSQDVQRWFLLFVRAVAADKTLGGLVIHAEPYLSDSGTAKDPDGRRYIADITFGVKIKAEIDPADNE